MGVSFLNLKILFGVLVMLFLVVGCVPKPAETQNQNEQTAPPAEQPAAPEQPAPKPELSQDIKDILAKTSKVKSFSYIYSENLAGTASYYVMGDKLKISYGPKQIYNSFNYYDIYIDRLDKKEYLVCNKDSECKGKLGTNITYGTFGKETPLDIANKIDNGQITERTQIDNKNTAIVFYTNSNGEEERVWLWDFYGLPLKREIQRNGKTLTILYDKLDVNLVEAPDVTLPSGLEMS